MTLLSLSYRERNQWRIWRYIQHLLAPQSQSNSGQWRPHINKRRHGPCKLLYAQSNSQVDVFLINIFITPSENTYPDRAYLKATLNDGKDAKLTHYSSTVFYIDTPNVIDETQGELNHGRKRWRDIAKQSKEIDMIHSCLHSDSFTPHCYMLNRLVMKIKLSHSKNVFSLLAPDTMVGCRSIIPFAALLVRKIKLNQQFHWPMKKP